MTDFLFDDQKRFMEICVQTTRVFNRHQLELYAELVREEGVKELPEAIEAFVDDNDADQIAEVADAALDTIVVAIGVLYSLGVDPQPLWDEVWKTNMNKIEPISGRVLKRPDGKVLKPEGWQPPQLARIIARHRSKFCHHCGAGIGIFRRLKEDSCDRCEPKAVSDG